MQNIIHLYFPNCQNNYINDVQFNLMVKDRDNFELFLYQNIKKF